MGSSLEMTSEGRVVHPCAAATMSRSTQEGERNEQDGLTRVIRELQHWEELGNLGRTPSPFVSKILKTKLNPA